MKTVTSKDGTVESRGATTIKDCVFRAVEFDSKAIESISLIATGLIENAKALGRLAEVLKASNVTVEAMIKLVQAKP